MGLWHLYELNGSYSLVVHFQILQQQNLIFGSVELKDQRLYQPLVYHKSRYRYSLTPLENQPFHHIVN